LQSGLATIGVARYVAPISGGSNRAPLPGAPTVRSGDLV